MVATASSAGAGLGRAASALVSAAAHCCAHSKGLKGAPEKPSLARRVLKRQINCVNEFSARLVGGLPNRIAKAAPGSWRH